MEEQGCTLDLSLFVSQDDYLLKRLSLLLSFFQLLLTLFNHAHSTEPACCCWISHTVNHYPWMLFTGVKGNIGNNSNPDFMVHFLSTLGKGASQEVAPWNNLHFNPNASKSGVSVNPAFPALLWCCSGKPSTLAGHLLSVLSKLLPPQKPFSHSQNMKLGHSPSFD
jgi:hypothetical protein